MTTHQRILILIIIAVFSAFIWKGGWAAWMLFFFDFVNSKK